MNLKNYAAPRGYGYGQSFSATKETTPPSSPPPPTLTLTSASPTTSSRRRSSESPSPPNLTVNTKLEMSSPTLSTATTSTDSTPIQTPTQGDESDGDEGWKVAGEEEEKLRWSLGMENGHFATTLMPSPISSPTTTPLGSPIPVSVPGDRNTFSYTSYHPKSGGVEMGTSPPFSDLKESVVGRGASGRSVYWDWGTAAGVATGGGETKKESAYESTGSTGLMPPQRRRGLQQQQQQKRGGSGSSSSSSGSDSNSKTSKLSLSSSSSTSTPTPIPPPTATSVVTLKQKPKPPKLDLPSQTFKPTNPTTSSSSVTTTSSPSGVQSPYPRRYNNNCPQPQKNGHRYYQSMPSLMGSNQHPKSPSTPGDSDAIYQALVREWCFAQGPSSSNSTPGETTPVLVKSPSPLGLVCALGDGE